MRRTVFDRARARFSAAVACAIALALLAASGADAEYAPVNKPGPKLELSAATLSAAMSCSADLLSAGREAVLLVPPTLVNDEEAFFGYERAFNALAIPYCTVIVPHHTTIDIQVAAEYT